MSMKQTTLTGFEKYGKTTRRAQFLADMDKIIPWPELRRRCRRYIRRSARTVGGRRFRWSGCCGSTSCSCGSTCRTRRLRKRSTTRSRCAPSSASIWGRRRSGRDDSVQVPAPVGAEQAGQGAAEGGERASASQRHQDREGHDRGRDDHRRAELDQEQGGQARPGDAPDGEGPAVVFRDEGARRSGQQDEADPHGTGVGGQRRTIARRCRICCMARRRGSGATRVITARRESIHAACAARPRTSPTSAIASTAKSTNSRRPRTATSRECEPRSNTCSA